MSDPPFLELRGLAKRFGETAVLEGLSLTVSEGEILALVGPSGSGKTTALRLIAGFESPDEGQISIAGEEVTALPPARRGVGMVFQHYALFPHMTVAENTAFGLEAQGWKQPRGRARVAEVLELVAMDAFGDRRVSQISGGQQQRVALARALAPEPRVLLLDEPLSNLDPTLRERTRRELRAAIRQIGITTVLVTHEQEEAFHIGDRVAVLHDGRLEQWGSPEELYSTPSSPFVAGFVGRASAIPGIFEGSRDGSGWVRLQVSSEATAVSWPGEAMAGLELGHPVDLIVRPEALRVSSRIAADAISGRLEERRFTGPLTYVTVHLEDGLAVEAVLDSDQTVGDRVYVTPRGSGPRPRIFARRESAR